MAETESIILDIKNRYGPIVCLRFTSRPTIFVASNSLAHRALVHYGAIFADRPDALPTAKIFSSNQHSISSAPYGPTWRLLRRNLTAEILHPSRVRSYSRARLWVLGILLQRLRNHEHRVPVVEHFRHAMFGLLLLMCFGDKLKEDQIQDVESTLRATLLNCGRYRMLNFLPRLGRILFRKRWKEFLQLRKEEENILLPLIKARIEEIQQGKRVGDDNADGEEVVAYVDTLQGLKLPDENRKLNDGEIVTLCNEFLNAGTDTTTTALEWIMANLVKYPVIQDKLYKDIVAVVGPPPPLSTELDSEVKEDDLHKIPYLKAVVLEALRRHPPAHFLVPHTVTEDVRLGDYKIPKNAEVNFMVADMGWDPEIWENPMEFRPERFLDGNESGDFDITGSKEIKMMPFGAGRRVCPGINLSMLHLEYFVANLIWQFEWKVFEGGDVDLSEKLEFFTVMKYPLKALIIPRVQSSP